MAAANAAEWFVWCCGRRSCVDDIFASTAVTRAQINFSKHRLISRNSMNTTDLIGYSSALLTTIAFVPQALHSLKTRDLSGISLPMYSLFSLGVLGWLIYGLMIDSWPIIVANCITLILACTVLYLKIKHR
jgi:MtN3 and saliva related transmembrane protein